MGRFDVDEFLAECQACLGETDSPLAVKELLQRTMQRPDRVANAMGTATKAEIVPLHVSDDLTVLRVVWAPQMTFRPHNHRTWAAIGLYGGQEDNTFYRRADRGLTESGGKVLQTGDAAVLGADVIHAVANPRRTFSGAIHIYGGNLPATKGRSEWDPESGEECPFDMDAANRYMAEANAHLASSVAD